MAQKAERFLLSRFAWLGCLLLLGLTMLTLSGGLFLVAAATLTAAAVIWTSPALPLGSRGKFWPRLHQALVILLVVVITASLWSRQEVLRFWLFALPLVALGLLPTLAGVIAVLAVVAAVMIAVPGMAVDPDRHQLISPLLLMTTLALVFLFLREYKSRQLAPLRRTDELTQAASREYLSADLHKEIQRSEREGIDMSVIMVGLDAHLNDVVSDPDIRAILPRIGRFLHSQLRDFDSYYRMADLQFLIILPGIATTGATTRAEQIRRGLATLLESHDLALTVSAGVAGLNIGDDADSLQQSAASALRRSQQKGGNRVQAYSTWSHTPPPDPATGDRS